MTAVAFSAVLSPLATAARRGRCVVSTASGTAGYAAIRRSRASQDGPTRWLACTACRQEPYRPPFDKGLNGGHAFGDYSSRQPPESNAKEPVPHARQPDLRKRAGVPPATAWLVQPEQSLALFGVVRQRARDRPCL